MSGLTPGTSGGSSSGSKSAFSRLVPPALSGSSLSSGGGGGSSSSSSAGVRALEALEALATTHGSVTSRARNASHESGRGRMPRDERERSSSVARSATGSETPIAPGSSGYSTRRNSLVYYTTSSGQAANDSSFSRIWASYGQTSGTPSESHFFAPGAFSFEGERARFIPHHDTLREDAEALYWDTPPRSPLAGFERGPRARRSRAIKHTVPTQAANERGITAISKSGQLDGRVAVVGRSFIKILQVPEPDDPSPPHSFASTSSLALRRSRSRGPSASVERTRSPADQARPGVKEIIDVRAGARLGPTYAATDVRWGYAATKEKIATSFTTGAVALWDLEKEGAKFETFKYEHDRTVNRVVFGGQTGSWLVSGGQNGEMKLWDIRDSRPASMILKSAAPVRDLRFSPSSAQPFTIVAVTSSGTMTRYDIRFVSRASGGATDRVAAHVGACLALDWRDNYRGQGEGDRKEGGWVATAGIDKTVKIWDFSATNLSTKPVRTLYASQPVQCVAWHPRIPTEVASSPVPSLAAEEQPSASGFGNVLGHETPATASWKNEIDIWDVRVPRLPKCTIKHDEPINSFVYYDEELLWSGSRTSTTFAQHDALADAYRVRDVVPRAAGVWSPAGSVCFVDEDRSAYDLLQSHNAPVEMRQVTTPTFKADSVACSATNMDPGSSSEQFAFLAQNLVLDGPLHQVCAQNGDVYAQAGRPDVKHFWDLVTLCFDASPTSLPDSPPHSPRLEGSSVDAQLTADSATVADETATKASDSGAPSEVTSLHSLLRQRSMSRELGRSPALQAADQRSSMLEDFSEESLSSTDVTPAPQERENHFDRAFAHTQSQSQSQKATSYLRNESVSGSRPPLVHRDPGWNDLANKLSSSYSMGAAKSLSRGRSPGRQVDPADHSAATEPKRRDHAQTVAPAFSGEEADDTVEDSAAVDDSSTSSGSGSEDDDRVAIDGSTVLNRAKLRRQVAQARSRRTSSNSDGRRPTVATRDLYNAVASASQSQYQPPSQSQSRARSRHGSQETSGGQSQAPIKLSSRRQSAMNEQIAKVAERRTSVELPLEELHKREASKFVEAGRELTKRKIVEVLREYADRGDSQLCAVFCCVVQYTNLDVNPMLVSRVTSAYIDQLRRLKLDVPAAALIRSCSSASIRATSQNHVVMHTTCGRCGKAVDSGPPFDKCPRCHSTTTRCAICNLSVRTLAIWCVGCGHVAHPACLSSLATTLSDRLEMSSSLSKHDTAMVGSPVESTTTKRQAQLAKDRSWPTTPSIVTPALKGWLYGEMEGSGIWSSDGAMSPVIPLNTKEDAESIRQLLRTCPSRFCEHEGCLLSSVMIRN